LIDLAAYTARARTGVIRDGYHREVSILPQVEGPGRLVKAYARLLGGLQAIGSSDTVAWAAVSQIAMDCVPALRAKVIYELVRRTEPVRTADVAAAIETATKTASRHLEDLSILRLATRSKQSRADNAADFWEATDWLRDYWPVPEDVRPRSRFDYTEPSPPHGEDGLGPLFVTSEAGTKNTPLPPHSQRNEQKTDDTDHGGVGFVPAAFENTSARQRVKL
jgi:hypothetical protein